MTLVELSPEGTDMDPRPDADMELDRATDTDRGTAMATEPLVPPVGSGYERHFLPTPEEVLGWARPTATHTAPVLTHGDPHSSDTDPEQPTATHTALELTHGDPHGSDMDPEQPTVIPWPWNQPTVTHTALTQTHRDPHD